MHSKHVEATSIDSNMFRALKTATDGEQGSESDNQYLAAQDVKGCSWVERLFAGLHVQVYTYMCQSTGASKLAHHVQV